MHFATKSAMVGRDGQNTQNPYQTRSQASTYSYSTRWLPNNLAKRWDKTMVILENMGFKKVYCG